MIKTPHLSVDGIVELYDENGRFQGIVLIERKNPPYGMAFPGGFVDIGESLGDALKREMKEEISLDVTISHLQGVYSEPARDPRFHTVSAVFVCRAAGMPVAADDAKRVHVFSKKAAKEQVLVFDHAGIMSDYLEGKTGAF